jgi:hypothetical protein
MIFSGHVRNPGRLTKAGDKCGDFYIILTLILLFMILNYFINIC